MGRPRTNLPPLHDLLAEFARYQKRRNITPWTARQRRHKVLALAAFHSHTSVLALSTEQLEEWLDSLPITVKTRSIYASHLRTFYRWATLEARYLRADPARQLTPQRIRRGLPRPIADGDLATALETADTRLLAILSLMAYEGLRCIEVSRLRGEDIDTHTMELRIHGKGDKIRAVPLHPHTLAALERHGLPDRGAVFVAGGGGTKGKAISAQWVSIIVAKHLPGRWTAHQLRHWFGTNFYRTSRDLLLTQHVMGHERPETTSIYAAADTSKAAEVVRRLDAGHAPDHAPDPGPTTTYAHAR